MASRCCKLCVVTTREGLDHALHACLHLWGLCGADEASLGTTKPPDNRVYRVDYAVWMHTVPPRRGGFDGAEFARLTNENCSALGAASWVAAATTRHAEVNVFSGLLRRLHEPRAAPGRAGVQAWQGAGVAQDIRAPHELNHHCLQFGQHANPHLRGDVRDMFEQTSCGPKAGRSWMSCKSSSRTGCARLRHRQSRIVEAVGPRRLRLALARDHSWRWALDCFLGIRTV